MKIFLIGVLVTVGLLALMFLTNYNSLISARAKVDETWAKVETQYQRRLDLIANLVGSVKGAQKQEVEVFGKIAESRRMYDSAKTVNDKVKYASQIETNLAIVPRLQEAYPELKSNAQVQSLMNQLEKTEDNIVTVRDTFNTVATKYNVSIKRFPTNLFAGLFGYEKVELFHSDKDAAKAVKVEF